MISRCGLTCTECPAYLATQANDVAKAGEVAASWAKQFHIKVTVNDVWCDGCLVEGRKCAHCGECKIRACATERGLDNCGHCDDFACDELQGFFRMVPHAKATLENILTPPGVNLPAKPRTRCCSPRSIPPGLWNPGWRP